MLARCIAIACLGIAPGCGRSWGPELEDHWIVGTYHAATVEVSTAADAIRQYEMTHDGAFVVRVLGCDATTSTLPTDRWIPHDDDTVRVRPGQGRAYLSLPELDFRDGLAIARDDGSVDLHLHTDDEIDGLLTLQPGRLCIAPICAPANVYACD
jgi:hypothetical protein